MSQENQKDTVATLKKVFASAGKRALQSGTSGASAMVVQVTTLMVRSFSHQNKKYLSKKKIIISRRGKAEYFRN